MNCSYQNKNERTTERGRNHIHGKKKKIDSFKLAIDMFSDDFMEDGRSDELQ